MCATGMWQLAEHATVAGTTGTIAEKLPPSVAAALNWSFDGDLLDGDLLVLAAHPQCPCLPASLAELRAILADAPHVTLRILAFEPSSKPKDWDLGARDALVQGFPVGTVVLDHDGKLANELGATTSGHFSLYTKNADLAFAGGITGSRGHRGDNPNSRALRKALLDPSQQPSRTVVFGCALQAPCSCAQ